MSDQPMPPMTPQMQPAQPPGPLKTGLAVTTLVLGIVSLLACPLLGIVAIITGIIAINQVSSAAHLHGGKRMAIAGLVCGVASIVGFPMWVWILVPGLSSVKEASLRTVCQANLKGIAVAVSIYQYDHPGQIGSPFDYLIAQGDVPPKQFICPSSGLSTSNYVYVPVDLNDPNVSADTVMLYEPKTNHGGEGGNVIFADGHAEFVKGDDYDRLIAGLPPPGP